MKLTKEEWIEYFKTELKLDDSYANAFAPTFVSEKIDKEVLCSLNNEDLKEIGITTLGERKLILLKIKEREERSREITSTKLSGEENLKHATHTPPKNSPGNTPLKKKSKTVEFIEKVKDCENIKEIVGEATAIITHLEDQNVKLEEEMEDLTWPIATRNAVFELEALFALSNVKICFQCGRPQSWHTKTCVPNPDTRMYPATDGVLQREFLRKSRLIWLLFEKEDQFDAFTYKYKIVALKLKLREYFNNLKMKKEEDRTPAEKIILPRLRLLIILLSHFAKVLLRYVKSRHIK